MGSDKLSMNWCRISAINSYTINLVMKTLAIFNSLFYVLESIYL